MYTRDNFEKVKGIIDARRSEAKRISEEHSDEVRVMSPDIAQIDTELRGVGMQILKAACEGRDINEIRSRNQELVRKRRELIKGLGFPEDYTDVKYTCEVCGDTGYVDIKMCNCFRSLLLAENVRSSGMGRLIDKQTFDNFRLDVFSDEQRKYMEKVVPRLRDFAEHFGSHVGENILLTGTTGTGKTHISSAIAKTVISKGYYVLYDSIQNVISAFETDTFRRGAESVSEKFLECDLLVLDDLGTEFTTPFTVSCIYNLINTRYNRGLSTVISTNLSPTELTKRYDDRIYSRLIGMSSILVAFNGEDYRLKSMR